MKKIMILGASILQLPAIQKAKEMGLQVIAVDMDPNAIGFQEDGVICEVISTIDIPAVLAAAKKRNIDGVMTLASDMPMRTVAVVAKELGLIGITEDTAFKATNKYAMREALKKHNVPVPMYYKVTTEAELVQAAKEIEQKGYRCIIKPADNSGSRGINLLSDYAENTLKEAFRYSKQYSRSGDVLVEEYMEGPEVSVETLSVDGTCHVIQITDKLTTGAPYFVEMGHSQPSNLSADVTDQIKAVAIAANHAIGITNGPSHTEIKVTKDGPKIVELGARLGGDNITTHLVPLSTGVNMVEACIKIALGEKPDCQPTIQKASAIRYFEQTAGIVKSIEGIENAKKLDGIKQISIVHGVGEHINEIKSSGDRLGFVIAQADKSCDAVKICKQAIDRIQIEVGNENESINI